MKRAALVLFAVVAALYAGAAPAVRAAEPTLGGSLGGNRELVIIESTASIPVSVTIAAPKGWQLAKDRVVLGPGERQTVPVLFAGEEGRFVATMTSLDRTPGIDRTSMVLSLGIPEPDGFPVVPVGLGILLSAVAIILLLERRRHRRGLPALPYGPERERTI